MRKNMSGFTIVELLVTIIVIGILTSIAVVSYNGVQKRTQNSNRATQLQAWQSVFERYKAAKGELPLPTTPDGTGYCLGSNFPTGYDGAPRCRDYLSSGSPYSLLQSDNSSLMSALQTVTPNLPTGQNIPSGGTVGPYVYYTGTQTSGDIQITGAFYGFAATDCPTGTQYSWMDGAGLLICKIYITR